MVTKHAYKRAKERLSWSRHTLDRMAERAFYEGFTHKDVQSALKKYCDRLYLEGKNANNLRIYGENIFLFHDEVLITVFRLSNGLLKYVRRLEEHKKNGLT